MVEEKVRLVVPASVNLDVIRTMSPSLTVSTKLILSMYLVTQSRPDNFLACIPALSSAHFINMPPCRLPWEFKSGWVTSCLKWIILSDTILFHIGLEFSLCIDQTSRHRSDPFQPVDILRNSIDFDSFSALMQNLDRVAHINGRHILNV